MSANNVSVLEQFKWEPQPKAQALVNELIGEFLAGCPRAAELAEKMRTQSATRFFDWIDHIHAPTTDAMRSRLANAGFRTINREGAKECYHNPDGIFPEILLDGSGALRIAVKVDSAADFAATWMLGSESPIVGEPFGQMRRVLAFRGAKGEELWAIERHGCRSYATPRPDAQKAVLAQKHLEALRSRKRDFANDSEGFALIDTLVDAAIKDLGVDWTCDLFFAAERDYWQRRNRAARAQKARQDSLGLGWANHDHHTYRCSREQFKSLIRLWEKLGFKARERFYAGAEAGWGAQVMEQPVTGITTFNDVDMSPEELMGDFAHDGLPAKKELGTVGLWCGLHGEAVLQAGMHHLECMFDWHLLVKQLEDEAHVKTMAPFTTFAYLRQAFTEGERWCVSEQRIARLLEKGQITKEQAEQFKKSGAIGSHLENLERNDGFKGFNQQGVSDIIARTDPRKLAQPAMAGA